MRGGLRCECAGSPFNLSIWCCSPGSSPAVSSSPKQYPKESDSHERSEINLCAEGLPAHCPCRGCAAGWVLAGTAWAQTIPTVNVGLTMRASPSALEEGANDLPSTPGELRSP